MDTALWAAIIGGLSSLCVMWAKQRQQLRCTNIAILTESKRLLTVLAKHKKWWERCVDSADTDYPLILFSSPVFDSHIKNIGQIDVHVVEVLVRFYGYLHFINQLQGQRMNYGLGQKSQEFNQVYLKALDRILQDHRAGLEAAFRSSNLG